MRSLQEEILELLGDREVEVDRLVEELSKRHQEMLAFDLRSALLPLMSTGLVKWTPSGKIQATKVLSPVC